ncbi:hypothetical protein GE09DRAFT_705607 [Coniochaeta sp. 2T2.1]|nr:hypothetical protein GE09DRAFT_705607 [Coniochaeta sp. 2T2.1]
MESVFTDAEKRFVLAEMIKVSHMDVGTLVDFVKYHDIAPDWMEMQLPGGRNIRQCLRAAELMFDMHLPPPSVPSLKRKSFEDISEQLPKRQAVQSPLEVQVYPPSRSFGSHGVTPTQHQYQVQAQQQPQQLLQHQSHMPPHTQHAAPATALPQLQPQPQAQPVNIKPRPPPNGFAASPSTSSPIVFKNTTSSTVNKITTSARKPNPTGRKRGRPSKADREAWARANPAQPAGYTPITPAPLAPQPSPSQPQATSYSPIPVGAPAYQFSTGPSSDPMPRSMGDLSSTADEQRYESVPRSIQPIASPETSEQHDHREEDIKEDAETQDLREAAHQTSQRTPPSNSGPIPSESHMPQTSALERHSGSPFAASALRGVIGPTMEQARNEGHPQVANQA